jgi:hypothetical protein
MIPKKYENALFRYKTPGAFEKNKGIIAKFIPKTTITSVIRHAFCF